MASTRRSEILRRARRLEQRHERELDELGQLALEMHRRDELDAEVLTRRAAEIAQIEKDLGELHIALEPGEESRPSGD